MKRKKWTIIIFSDGNDFQANYILQKLIEKWEDVVNISWEDFPLNIKLSYEIPFNRINLIIWNRQIDNIKTIYWRNYFWPSIWELDKDPYMAMWNTIWEKKMLIYRNNETVIKSLFELLPKKIWLNPPNSIYTHWLKPFQLNIISKHINHIKIPHTNITNISNDLISHIRRNKKLIIKPVLWWFSTKLIEKKDIKNYNENFSYFPCTIQQYISWKNLRVYVVWNNVYPIEIISNNIDYRDDKYSAQKIKLPKEIENECIIIAKKLKYKFTWIDIRENNWNYYYLEANPSPIFLKDWNDTGYPILEDLIKLLIK